jgi:hypothetical protein
MCEHRFTDVAIDAQLRKAGAIGRLAALARRFKHVVGPDVSFRKRGIALRLLHGVMI